MRNHLLLVVLLAPLFGLFASAYILLTMPLLTRSSLQRPIPGIPDASTRFNSNLFHYQVCLDRQRRWSEKGRAPHLWCRWGICSIPRPNSAGSASPGLFSTGYEFSRLAAGHLGISLFAPRKCIFLSAYFMSWILFPSYLFYSYSLILTSLNCKGVLTAYRSWCATRATYTTAPRESARSRNTLLQGISFFRTLAWTVLVKLLFGLGKPRTYSYQNVIPRLSGS